MSIIAIDNIPAKESLKGVVKILQKPIHGPFEALNFSKSDNPNQKICYVQLSAKLDPALVVQKINNPNFKSGKLGRYFAFIPDKVPNIALGTSSKSKLKRMTPAMRKQQNLQSRNTDGKVLGFATDEIIGEMQARFNRLYDLSQKYNHKLLHEISKVITSRVEELVEGNPSLKDSCFLTTRAYRRAHAHTTDLQLVTSALHVVQDSLGEPRKDLELDDLVSSTVMHKGLDLPMGNVKSLSDKYGSKIIAKMTEHINALDTTVNETDTEEDMAKKQVRMELKKLQPFLNLIVNQVIAKQFTPAGGKSIKMRIYAEPYLPNREIVTPFVARFKPRRLMRSQRMYNMMMLGVSPATLPLICALNGHTLSGVKLTIVPSDEIRPTKWKHSLGEHGEHGENEEEQMDEEQEQENWNDNDVEM